jgi:hypothetical protein
MEFPLFTGHIQKTGFSPICPMVDEAPNTASVTEPGEIENRVKGNRGVRVTHLE